jgi:ABC-2 type transport system permease protein
VNGRAGRHGALLRRELRRQTSVPAPWLLLGCALLMAAGTTAALHALHSPPSGPAALAALPALAGLLGALGAGADIRYGSLPAELLLAGGRTRYASRLAAALAVLGAGLGAVSAAAAVLTAVGLATAPPVGGRVEAFFAAGAFAGACWAVLGAGLAIVARGPTGAVASLLAYLLLIEPMLEAAVRPVAATLPGRATAALLAIPPPATLAGGGLRLLAVTLLVAACAHAALLLRDVPVTTG